MLNKTKITKISSAILGAILAVWVGVSGIVYLLLPGNVFNPDFAYLTEPSVFKYEQSFLSTDYDDKFSIWFTDNQNTDEVVLYLHGNAGRTFHLYEDISKKYDVLSPAYPGYHESEGQANFANTYNAALKAYDYLVNVKKYPENKIIIYGHSMGGAPAIYLASQKPNAQKLVTVNTFASVKDMCKDAGYSVFCAFSGKMFPSSEYAQKVTIPVRQFHYTGDKKVPYTQAEELSKNFTSSKDFKFIDLQADTHSYFNTTQTLE